MDLRVFAGRPASALDPKLPGAIIAGAPAALATPKRPVREAAAILVKVPLRLVVVQDDLFFAARVASHAARLGLAVEPVSPNAIETLALEADRVVVMQITLHSERQLALLKRLRSRQPAPLVVAVSGHLETDLRRRAKRLGAVLASNSGLDRVLARICGIRGPGTSSARSSDPVP